MNKSEFKKNYKNIIKTGQIPYLVFHTSTLDDDQYQLVKDLARNTHTLIFFNMHPNFISSFNLTKDSIEFRAIFECTPGSVECNPRIFKIPLANIQIIPTPYMYRTTINVEPKKRNESYSFEQGNKK